MKLEHDLEADAIYIYLSSKPYTYGIDLDNELRIDYADDNTPVGVELLCVSNGVNVTDIPYSQEIAELLHNEGISVYMLNEVSSTSIHSTGISWVFSGFSDFDGSIYEEQPELEESFSKLAYESGKAGSYRFEVRKEEEVLA